MERLAYIVKQRFPGLFLWIEAAARAMTVLRYGRQIRRARDAGIVRGVLYGETTVMRSLGSSDLETLHGFLAEQPERHLHYFRPHGFDRATLHRVLASDAFLKYGLFVGERMIGYALLKIAPTGSAFIGLLVEPGHAGKGLGGFIVRFLYWQASLAGLRARSTISRDNPSSLGAHRSVAEYKVISELPNNYLLIEFPPAKVSAPALDIP